MINGLLREFLLLPWLGLTPALLISGLLLSLLILGAAWLSLPWLKLRGRGNLLALGTAWLLLTLLFESVFDFAQGKTVAELLAAYTFQDGNIWPLVLAVTWLAPLLAASLRR